MSQLDQIVIDPQISARLPGIFLLQTEVAIPSASAAVVLESEWQELRARWQGADRAAVAADARIGAVIALYRALGLDVRTHPPAAQNFINRFLTGPAPRALPQIHPVVDAVNCAAVRARIPLAALDADRVRGLLRLVPAQTGDLLTPIGSPQAVAIPESALVLRDDARVISWFCHRDSAETMITPATRRVYLIGCGVPGLEPADTAAALDDAVRLIARSYAPADERIRR